MIAGSCFTNLDDFSDVRWPEKFAAVPRVGERVEGSRRRSGMDASPSLKVVAVTHCLAGVIRVELHR